MEASGSRSDSQFLDSINLIIFISSGRNKCPIYYLWMYLQEYVVKMKIKLSRRFEFYN